MTDTPPPDSTRSARRIGRTSFFSCAILAIARAGILAILAAVATAARTPDEPSLGAVVDRILDPATPAPEREKAIDAHAGRAAELVAEMARRIAPDRANEYDLIPWMWRVAHRAGKRGDAPELRAMMDVSMPVGADDPFLDWQCVVLGGGVVMGIADTGDWPRPRVAALLEGMPEEFARRWERSLELAINMADDENVPPPTRYDALRMLCVLPLERARDPLVRNLAPGTEEEVQAGAVHGLLDLDDDGIAEPLIDALPGLAKKNRRVAVKGLLRTPARALALLEAVAEGRVPREEIDAFRERELREHSDERVRGRAVEVLGGAQGR